MNNVPPKVTTEIETVHTDVYQRSGDDPSNYASVGGRVTAMGVSYYASGTSNVLSSPSTWPSKGTDTVPAMLTPGESVQSVSDTKSTAANLENLAAIQKSQAATLEQVKRLLADQPRAIGIAVNDAQQTKKQRIA